MSLLVGGSGQVTPPPPPDVGDLLQPFVDGDYDNGYIDFFGTASGFPAPGSDTLLATTRLETPAVASTVSSTDIILAFTNDSPTILADSNYTVPKYFRITTSDHTSGAIYGSVGLSDADFDPALVVSSMTWSGGGSLSLAGVVHVRSVADTIDHYSVTPSTSAPISGASYTATAQAKTSGGVSVSRIIPLTASYVGVSGTGDGSITNGPTFFTNRYGVTDTIDVTAGTYPTTEKVHVTDGTHTGDSADVVVQAAPAFTLVDHTYALSTGFSTGGTTPAIDTTGATLITIGISNYSFSPSVSDSYGNTWTKRKENAADHEAQLWDCINPTVGPGHTFSMEHGVSAYTAMAVAAWADTGTPSADQTNLASSSGATIQPGSVTPGADKSLIVTVVRADAAFSGTLAIDSGFTILESHDNVSSQSMAIGFAYLIQTSASAVNPTWSGLSGNTESAIVTYTPS